MIGILRSGGSVIFNGTHIKELSDLPSASEIALASGDKEVQKNTEAELQAQLEDTKRQLEEIRAANKSDEQPVKPAKTTATPKTTEV